MNKILIFMLIGMIFIVGCQLPTKKSEITDIKTDITKLEYEAEGIKYYQYCSYSGYVINYVDEIMNDNCYAIRQKKSNDIEYFLIKTSFEIPYDAVFGDDNVNIKENAYCFNIKTYGNIYCLKDNSTCLIIEGNICNIINVTEILTE